MLNYKFKQLQNVKITAAFHWKKKVSCVRVCCALD